MTTRKFCSYSNNEIAKGDMLLVLAALRQLGRKTMVGLMEIARHAEMGQRRAKSIVFEDQPSIVTDDQRRHLSLSMADMLDRLADEHERKAEALRLKGDGIRQRERQQLTWIGGAKWGGSTICGLRYTTSSQRRAA